MRNHLVAAMLAAATLLLSVLPAQQVGGGPDPDRRGSTLFVFADDGTISTGIAIGYSQAKWRAEYEGMLTTLRCKYARLGKNWWTTFDTVTALEIGGVRVEAGSYYLGIAVDDDGSFHLLLFASDKAMKAGLLPFFSLDEITVLTGLQELWRQDVYLAVLVTCFALFAPYLRTVGVALIQFGLMDKSTMPILQLLGKLAMADIFLISLYIILLKGIGIGRVETAWGLYLFTGCVIASFIISFLSSRQFNG